MKWATRKHIHIDRAASAWLISAYVDPDATFIYVDDPDDVPNDATPFDIVGCDLSHHGPDITFETILRRYELADPVLWKIAEIIHEADVEDGRYDAPEAPGFDVIIRALGHDHDDESVRRIAATMLTSLELFLREQTLGRAAG